MFTKLIHSGMLYKLPVSIFHTEEENTDDSEDDIPDTSETKRPTPTQTKAPKAEKYMNDMVNRGNTSSLKQYTWWSTF